MGVSTLEKTRAKRLEELCKNSSSPRLTDKQLSELLSCYGLDSDSLIKKAREQVKRTHGERLRDDGENVIYQHINWVAYNTIKIYINHNNLGSEELFHNQKIRQDLIILGVAGLLHDVVEVDPSFFNNPNLLEDEFGSEVSSLVIPVTRPYWKNFKGRTKAEKKNQAEITYRNNLLNAPPGSKLIKGTDRLGNTLSSIALLCKLSMRKIDESFYSAKVKAKNKRYINDGEFYIKLAKDFPILREQIEKETKKFNECYNLFNELYHKKRGLYVPKLKVNIPVVPLYRSSNNQLRA